MNWMMTLANDCGQRRKYRSEVEAADIGIAFAARLDDELIENLVRSVGEESEEKERNESYGHSIVAQNSRKRKQSSTSGS